MGVDVLGDLVVDVGADLSDLSAKIGEAVGIVEQGGKAMASAFDGIDLGKPFEKFREGAEDAIPSAYKFTSALDQINAEFAKQMQTLSDAQANLAIVQHAFDINAASAGQLADAAQRVQRAYADLKGPTQEVASEIESLNSQFVKFAEALVVAEALREFAGAALEAFSQVERFTVSMTQLAGSSQAANQRLQEIVKLAATKPFEFEELARAEQRMTAFGVASDKVTSIMKGAMDAAAATGNSFTLISNSLERTEVTGSITARQLNQLGISFKDMAETAGVSVLEIEKMVRKGGQDAEADLDLLMQTIQRKFSGASEALAQTLSGQWQTAKNEMTLAMAEIGAAIAPTMREWVDTLKGDAIPALESVTKLFVSLPQPVKDTSLALVGLAVAATSVSGALKLINIAGVELSQTGLSGLALAAAGVTLMQSIRGWLQALDDVNQSEETLRATLEKATAYLRAHKIEVDSDGPSLAAWRIEVQKGFEELAKGGPTIQAHNASLDRLSKSYQEQKDTVASARKELDLATEAYSKQLISAGMLADAQKKYDEAMLAMDPHWTTHTQLLNDAAKVADQAAKSFQKQMDDGAKAAQGFSTWLGKLPQDEARFNEEMSKSHDWLNKADTDIDSIQRKMDPLIADWAMFAASGTKAGQQIAAGLLTVIQHGEELKKNIEAWKAGFGDWEKEFEKLPVIARLTAAEMRAVAAAAKDMSDPLKDMLNQLPKAATVIDGLAVNTKAWDDALKRLGLEGKKSLDEVATEMTVLKASIESGEFTTGQLVAGFDHLVAATLRAGGNVKDLAPLMKELNPPMAEQQKYWEAVLADELKSGASVKEIAATLGEITRLDFKQWVSSGKILVDTWKDMETAFASAFHTFSQGVAQSIVEGKSFADVWHSLIKKLAEDILTTLIEGAFREMLGGIAHMTGGLGGLLGQMGQITSSFGKVTQSANTMSASVNNASTSALQNISSVGSGALGIIQTISGIVSAIVGILSYFEMRHMAADLQKIEKSTRYTEIYTGEQSDSILATSHLMLDVLKIIAEGTKGLAGAIQSIGTETKAATAALAGIATAVAGVGAAVKSATFVPPSGSSSSGAPANPMFVTDLARATNPLVVALDNAAKSADQNAAAVQNQTTQAAAQAAHGAADAALSSALSAMTNNQGINAVNGMITGRPGATTMAGASPDGSVYRPATSAEEQAAAIASDLADMNADPWHQAATAIQAALQAADEARGLPTDPTKSDAVGAAIASHLNEQWDKVTSVLNDLAQGNIAGAKASLMERKGGLTEQQATDAIAAALGDFTSSQSANPAPSSDPNAEAARVAAFFANNTILSGPNLPIAQTAESMRQAGTLPSGLTFGGGMNTLTGKADAFVSGSQQAVSAFQQAVESIQKANDASTAALAKQQEDLRVAEFFAHNASLSGPDVPIEQTIEAMRQAGTLPAGLTFGGGMDTLMGKVDSFVSGSQQAVSAFQQAVESIKKSNDAIAAAAASAPRNAQFSDQYGYQHSGLYDPLTGKTSDTGFAADVDTAGVAAQMKTISDSKAAWTNAFKDSMGGKNDALNGMLSAASKANETMGQQFADMAGDPANDKYLESIGMGHLIPNSRKMMTAGTVSGQAMWNLDTSGIASAMHSVSQASASTQPLISQIASNVHAIATAAPRPYEINVTVQAGVVAGNNGMQQLAGMIQDKVVSSLKGTAGLKI